MLALNMFVYYKLSYCLLLIYFINLTGGKKFKDEEKPAWAKKDFMHYSDADFERLLDQWEEGDDPLEEDELPEHLRPQPAIDFSQMQSAGPEALLKLSKKGKTLMVFVVVDGTPTREETEDITKLWQTSLWNSHIQAERYLIDDNRAIFMFKDGSQAWDAKEHIVEQERCKEVIIENKSYPGRHAGIVKEESHPEKQKERKSSKRKPIDDEL